MGLKKKGVGPFGVIGSIHDMEGLRRTIQFPKVAAIAYVNALHNILVAQPGKEKKINVFSCCPGYVDTDINGKTGVKTCEEGADTPRVKTSEEGADTPVWLALHSPERGSGKFWTERKVIEF